MRRLKDFQCPHCEAIYERFVSEEVTEMMCECGNFAYPMIGTPTIQLEGITGSFPGAYSRWAKIREDNARIKARRNDS